MNHEELQVAQRVTKVGSGECGKPRKQDGKKVGM